MHALYSILCNVILAYRVSSKKCSATAMMHLFKGGAYSRAMFNSVTGAHLCTYKLFSSHVSFQQEQ